MTNIAEAYHIVYDTQGDSAKAVSAFLESYFTLINTSIYRLKT